MFGEGKKLLIFQCLRQNWILNFLEEHSVRNWCFLNFHEIYFFQCNLQGSVLDGLVYIFIIIFFSVVYNIIKFFELQTVRVQVNNISIVCLCLTIWLQDHWPQHKHHDHGGKTGQNSPQKPTYVSLTGSIAKFSQGLQ